MWHNSHAMRDCGQQLILSRVPRPAQVRTACLVLVLSMTGMARVGAGAEKAPEPFSVRVLVTTNLYPVTGSTLAELHASKVNSRPWKTNGVYDGLTVWSLEWDYRAGGERGQVRLVEFVCKNKVVVTLPRWLPPAGAEPGLVKGWNRFINSLGRHEDGHVMLARHATAEFYRKVMALGAFGSGRELQAELERISNQITSALRQRDEDYDRRTRHGAGSN
jgi:predicted secreted Zn-dependent protease